jgi:glucose/arabinose dehydrogenase
LYSSADMIDLSRPLLVSLLLAGCSGGDSEEPSRAGGKADDFDTCTPETQTVTTQPAFGGLRFESPVGLLPSPVSASRWYVVEKRGVVWAIEDDGATVFADLRSRVNAVPSEAGLLGLAFSPDFADDGRVYVSYTAPSATSPANLRSRLSRMVSDDGGATLDPASEEILFSVDQPFENHNGGHIAFGPDGFLYLALGDGGAAGDPGNRAQNLQSPLGKLLRIDVSVAQGYAIPADNPFAGGGGLGEIYAWGLRNPWRFSFDTTTARLWAGDVGQDAFEEIDLIVRGGNYGWRVREGDHCFDPPLGCPSAGFIAPVAEYGHGEGVSITGGFVYRGQAIPALVGQYLFADFGSGRFFALLEGKGSFSRRLVADTSLNVSSFGQGPDGELYAVDFGGGIFKIVGEICGGGGGGEPDAGPVSGASFRDIYQTVIEPECGPCHTTSSSGGLRMPSAEVAFDNLVGVDATTAACAGGLRVAPGDAEASVLYRKVSGEDLCGPRMPLGGMLSSDQIDAIRDWIDQGAEL